MRGTEFPDSNFIDVLDDLTIHYRAAGMGKQVVLLVPGWTISGAVFEKQLLHYRDSRAYKIIAIDPRSQGLSTRTPQGNFYEQHGRDLKAFIDTLGLKDVILGGWSFGGLDILAYVHQFGCANLRGLMMLDAAPRGTGSDNSQDSQEWVWCRQDDANRHREWFTQGALLERQAMNNELARRWVDDATPEYLAWMSEIMNQTSNGVAALLNESGAYQNYDADLRNLEGKLPLLYCVRSTWQAVDNWAKENTPSAAVVKFGKHLAMWEYPEKINPVLDAFLSKAAG